MTPEQRGEEFDRMYQTANTPTERYKRARFLVSQVLGATPKLTASLCQLRWMYVHQTPIPTAMEPVDMPVPPLTPPSSATEGKKPSPGRPPKSKNETILVKKANPAKKAKSAKKVK